MMLDGVGWRRFKAGTTTTTRESEEPARMASREPHAAAVAAVGVSEQKFHSQRGSRAFFDQRSGGR